MASIPEKYRKTTALLFLLFYLAGVFQRPALEALHFLSHLNHKVQQYHFYHHADAATNHHHHHHNFLELVGDLLTPFPDKPAPAGDRAGPLKKKFAECLAAPLLFISLSVIDVDKPESRPSRLKFFFTTVPTPPPRRA